MNNLQREMETEANDDGADTEGSDAERPNIH